MAIKIGDEVNYYLNADKFEGKLFILLMHK